MAESEAEPDGTFPMTDVLRAPLEKITRQAEAIRSQSFGYRKSVYTDYAGDIATAAHHMWTLIDDVFDVEAIEPGTVSSLMGHVDRTRWYAGRVGRAWVGKVTSRGWAYHNKKKYKQ